MAHVPCVIPDKVMEYFSESQLYEDEYKFAMFLKIDPSSNTLMYDGGFKDFTTDILQIMMPDVCRFVFLMYKRVSVSGFTTYPSVILVYTPQSDYQQSQLYMDNIDHLLEMCPADRYERVKSFEDVTDALLSSLLE